MKARVVRLAIVLLAAAVPAAAQDKTRRAEDPWQAPRQVSHSPVPRLGAALKLDGDLVECWGGNQRTEQQRVRGTQQP